MAVEAKNHHIGFGFDPYKWIEDGIKIAVDNNLGQTPLSNLVNKDGVPNKDYNKYGYKANSSLSIEQQFDINSGLGTFLDSDLISKVNDMYTNISAKLDLGGDIKPSRIKFTDRPLGIFTFSQASKGLIRPVEYYSKEDDSVIDANLIFKGKINELEYFYYLKDSEQIIVERRQEGTTEMVKHSPFLKVMKDEVSGLYLPYDSDGKIVIKSNGYALRFTSTNKKVYAYRTKSGGGISPYVDLYIASGQNFSYDPEQMLIQAMPNILLARILEKSGVKVRIFGYFNQDISNTIIDKFFMIKNYGEPVDLNKICVFLADTRFFRFYLWNACTGWNYDIMKKRGYGGSDGRMMPTETFNREIMPFVRNYVSYKISAGEFPSQVVNKKLMLFGGLDVSSGQKFETQRTQDQITDRFYSLIDYVQLQLSKNPRVVLQEIIKREKDRNKPEGEIKRYIRNSITDVLTPTNGVQKETTIELKNKLDSGKINKEDYENRLRVLIQLDTPEEADSIIEEREKLFSILNNLMP
jgi:hypothetical protein